MRYYIADTHFFHADMNNRFDMRGFDSVEMMNEHMIEKWNSRVRKKDEVVILGDLSYGNAQQTNELLKRLNGILYLIEGNHDFVIHDKDFDASRFVWIKDYAQMHDNGRRIVLCHYPVMCYNGQYNVSPKGRQLTYMLHGHVHATKDQQYVDDYVRNVRKDIYVDMEGNETGYRPCSMINCFCMYSGYVPQTLDEWVEINEKRLSR